MQVRSLPERRLKALGVLARATLEGRDEMADGLKRYWFVAAVYREPHDLVSTLAELRGNGFRGDRLLVVANHRTEDARKALDGSQAGSVPVIAVRADGATKAGAPVKLPTELRALMEAMDGGDPVAPVDGGGQSQVYQQLRQDVADGAVVLVASVANPDEQLLGARILLRGNCECVLTHEIAG
jgi:hypothetical protein